ncbi:MAG: trigger factor [Magnetococcales bacterium]|nr:trigger factor [Magnetococcales bacterium]
MQVTVEKTATFDRQVTIRIPAAEVDHQLDQELHRLAQTVKLPGFRPGKVPRHHLESRFRDHLNGAVMEQLLKTSYPTVLRQESLVPVDEPDMNLGELQRGHDFVYVARIQVMPEVEPQGYRGLELTRRAPQVTDQDVDAALEKLRESMARFEAQEGATANPGDQVVMDFTGYVDDAPFEGGEATGYVLELGSGRFIPGFEDQLIGGSVGEEREVRVTFPEQYGAPHLAGKEALFRCRINEVRARVLPPLDDALAEAANVAEGGLARLRESLAETIREEAERGAERLLHRQIRKQLVQANPMELPERMLERERNSMVEYAKREYQIKGLDPAQAGLTDEVLAAGFKDAAARRVTLGLLLSAIATRENLTADEAKVAQRIGQLAAAYGPQAGNFKKWLQNDPNRMEEIRDTVLEDTVLEWIVQHGVVTEESCAAGEMFDQDEQE